MSKCPSLAAIIATKNRAEAIKQYALPSLERSELQNFICVVWDASDDISTQEVIEHQAWPFVLIYFRAPRTGLAAQRNDAIRYVSKEYPNIKYLVFIDDDSELSSGALEGICESFQDEKVWGVNIPHVSVLTDAPAQSVFSTKQRRRVTSCLYNQATCPEPNDVSVEWLSGCSMAFRAEVFRDMGLRFPEAFQKFGGYALGEDVVLSYYLHKKMKKKMINSVSGTLCHHSYGSARLNIVNMAASKWHNFHLLFDAIYDDVSGPKLLWLKIQFKLFMCAAAAKLLIRARSLDIFSVIKGINAARAALKEFYETQDIKQLMRAPGSHDSGGSQK